MNDRIVTKSATFLVHAVNSTHMMISTLTSAEKGFVHFGEKWNHLSSRTTNSAAWR
jgi:hypothetical protein